MRSTPADANNMIEVECLDRQNNYNTAVAEAFDQGSIDVYGVRRDTSTKARLITDPLYVGGMVAQLIVQAKAHYDAAQAALHNGDFATYGKEIQQVGSILNQLAALQSASPSPSASPKASP